MSLWDDMETLWEGMSQYRYSGKYIYARSYPKIHKDPSKTAFSIQQAAFKLLEPRCVHRVDVDHRPSLFIEGWVEMTDDQKARREQLREHNERKKEERKARQEEKERARLAELQEKYPDGRS